MELMRLFLFCPIIAHDAPRIRPRSSSFASGGGTRGASLCQCQAGELITSSFSHSSGIEHRKKITSKAFLDDSIPFHSSASRHSLFLHFLPSLLVPRNPPPLFLLPRQFLGQHFFFIFNCIVSYIYIYHVKLCVILEA